MSFLANWSDLVSSDGGQALALFGQGLDDGLEEVWQVEALDLGVGVDADNLQEEVDEGAHLDDGGLGRADVVDLHLVLVLQPELNAGRLLKDLPAKVPNAGRLEGAERKQSNIRHNKKPLRSF